MIFNMTQQEILNIPDIKNIITTHYLVDNKSLKELCDLYSCSSATISRVLRKLDIKKDHDLQSADVIKNTAAKYELDPAELQSYFDEHNITDTSNHFNVPIKYLYRLFDKYNIDRTNHDDYINKHSRLAGKTPEEKRAAMEKGHQTKIERDSYKKSKAEDAYGDALVQLFGTDDVERQYYKDSRYPYFCDFYIKSKDLFIEYQGYFTHGAEPYDELNPKHWEYVEFLDSTAKGSGTFTVSDPAKLARAKQTGINLLLIYPKYDAWLVKNGILKNIGKISVADINDIC